MKQLLILSGKGGTGKTTIASAFIKLSAARAYADCDVDAPNLHLISDWENEPVRSDYYGLPVAQLDSELCTECGICKEKCRFDAISFEDGRHEIKPYSCEGCGVCAFVCPVDAITMMPAVAGEKMLYADDTTVFSTAQLKMGSGTSGLLVSDVKKQMKNSASPDAALAIIDGSPGIGCPVIASISGVDMVLIVAEPSISGFSDMERVIDTAAKFGTETAICVNKYDTNNARTQMIEEFCKKHGLPFVGKIPYDSAVIKALNMGKNIIDTECISGEAVKDVYHNTMNLLFDKNLD